MEITLTKDQVTQCAWCKRVHLVRQKDGIVHIGWARIEPVLLKTYKITHGICHPCRLKVMAEVSGHQSNVKFQEADSLEQENLGMPVSEAILP